MAKQPQNVRDAGPPVPSVEVNAAPDRNAGATDLPYQEMPTGGDYVVGVPIKAANMAWDAVKAVTREAIMPALEKLIPQGAAEVAQGLYTGSAYVPYGPTETPVPIDHGPGIHGAAAEAPAVEPPGPAEPNGYQVFAPDQSPSTSYEMNVGRYDAMLADAAQHGLSIRQDQDRGRGR